MNLSIPDLISKLYSIPSINYIENIPGKPNEIGIKYTTFDYKSPFNPTSSSFYRKYQIKNENEKDLKSKTLLPVDPITDPIKLDDNEAFRTSNIIAINKKEKVIRNEKEQEIIKPILIINGREIEMSHYHGSIHSKVCGSSSPSTFSYFGWQGSNNSNQYEKIEISKEIKENIPKRYFVYHAERKINENEPPGTFKQSWGEGMPNIIDPVLVVLDLEQSSVSSLDSSIQSISSSFNSSNNGNSINFKVRILDFEKIAISKSQISSNGILYFIGYHYNPFKYGLYCFQNRPSSIYKYDLNDPSALPISITTEPQSINDLVLFENKLAFIGNTVYGSHRKTPSLYFIDLNDNQFKARKASNSINLYLHFRFQDALSDGRVYFNNIYRHDYQVCFIDMKNEIVKCQFASKDNESYMLVSRTDARFISKQRQNLYPEILFNNMTEKGDETALMELTRLDLFKEYQDEFSSLEQEIISINEFVEIILLRPSLKLENGKNGKLPLIFFPHGGPNSVFVTEFSIDTAALALAGYAVASINYTGSIGYGEKSIRRLEGNVEILSIEDCMKCIERLKRLDWIDSSQFFYFGGSHAGYIGAMMTAKYPDLLKAAVLLNPVIDYRGAMEASDASDYRFSLFNMPFDYERPRIATMDELKIFQERSPSSYAHSVKTPTLLLLGSDDKRVPWTNGQLWYKLLKGNGVSVEINVFQDGHALSEPLSDRNVMVNTLEFFKKYLN